MSRILKPPLSPGGSSSSLIVKKTIRVAVPVDKYPTVITLNFRLLLELCSIDIKLVGERLVLNLFTEKRDKGGERTKLHYARMRALFCCF